MKPGNLLIQGAKSGGKTRDEDSIFTHIGSFGVRFFIWKGFRDNNGKKTVYF